MLAAGEMEKKGASYHLLQCMQEKEKLMSHCCTMHEMLQEALARNTGKLKMKCLIENMTFELNFNDLSS